MHEEFLKNSNKKFKNWDEHLDSRIEILENNNLFLEVFFLYASTIEFLLQNSIFHQESLINLLIKNRNLKMEKTSKLEKKTLGSLIDSFSRYCTDGDLILRLKEFNQFRIQCVHHILENSISDLNEKSKNKRKDYYKLVQDLSEYNINLFQ